MMSAFIFATSVANAQSIQAPQSMNGAAPKPYTIVPAQQVQPNAEQKGYSIAFLAYNYNEACKLGLPKPTIDNLANQLSQAEQQQQITTETINKNVADAQRIYKEDPVKFCEDARQVASVIRQLFAGQPAGQEQIPEPIKQMYINQAK